MSEFYSVSKLKSYSTCPAYYEHKYVHRTPHVQISSATMLGNFVHEALEQYYSEPGWDDMTLTEVFETSGLKSLVNVFNLPADPETLDGLHARLRYLATSMQGLYTRASSEYTGDDAIRKGDGGVAIKPESTSAWKKAEAALDLTRLCGELDAELAGYNRELAGMHPSMIFVEAFNLCRQYKNPAAISKVHHVEYAVSARSGGEIINPLRMPLQYGGAEGIYLTSYIDLVAEIDGKLAIIDHKTSKELVTPSMVMHNSQLAAYAWAYQQITGEKVSYVAINHIRNNELVVAPANAQTLSSAFRNLVSYHDSIKSGIFPKQAPDSEYSKCLNMYNNPCPFLAYCHPTYQA